MPPIERRFLLCNDKCVKESDLHLYPKCHILGELVYVVLESRRVTVLTLWRDYWFTDHPHLLPLEPDILIEKITSADGIRCLNSKCKGVANWEMSKASFAALESRYGRQQYET